MSITRFCSNLPFNECHMVSIFSCIVVGLVNRGLSDGSVTWSCVRRRNYTKRLHLQIGLQLVSIGQIDGLEIIYDLLKCR